MTRFGPVRARLLAVAAIAIVLAATLPVASQASARSVWCSGDPLVLVNGNPVSVTVSVPLDRLSSVKLVTVTYHVPSNAKAAIQVNDSLLFPAKIVVVKDQPATYGLVSVAKIPVDISISYTGSAFPIGATTIALLGTNLWQSGTSDQVMHVTTYSLLGLRLL